MRERDRLLPEDHPAAITFDQNARRITARLLQGSYDPTKIRFMLSADKDPNAFIQFGIEPPVIVLSRGLIELAKSEDEMAAVIAHELNHKHLRDRFGHHEVTKGEETFADLATLEMLREAGYRQDAMRTIMERLPDSSMSIFATLSDPHPKKDLRVRMCADAGKAINMNSLEGKGEQHLVASPRPPDLLKALPTAEYTQRHIENVLRAENFESATPLKKIEILKNIIPRELAAIGREHQAVYDFRLRDLCQAIIAIKPETKHPGHQKAFAELVDIILEAPEKNMKRPDGGLDNILFKHTQKLYAAAEQAWTGEPATIKYDSYELKPIGHLKTMGDALQKFLDAKTPEAAEKNARIVNEIKDRYTSEPESMRYAVVRYVNWPHVDYPHEYQTDNSAYFINNAPEKKRDQAIKKHAITHAWDKQAAWAQSLGSKEIAITLKSLCADDPRLPPLSEDEQKRVHRIFVSYSEREFDFTPDGKIMGAKDSIYTSTNPRPLSAAQIAQQKTDADVARMASGEWKKEMETDFHAFVQNHKTELLPRATTDFTSAPEATGFAQVFCDHLRELLKRDPGKYAPLANEFFGASTQTPAIGLHALIDGKLTEEKIESYRHDHYAISPTHPYIAFVVENPQKALTKETRLKMYDRTHYSVSKHSITESAEAKYRSDDIRAIEPYRNISYKDCWRLDPDVSLPMQPITNFATLNKVMEPYAYGQPQYDVMSNSGFLQDRLRYEMTHFLEKNKAPCGTDEMWHFVKMKDSYSTDIRHTQFNELVKKQLGRNVANDLSASLPLEDLVKNYNFYSGSVTGLFAMDPPLKRRYEDKILEVLERTPDAWNKRAATWRLLTDSRLEQPDFRDAIVRQYVDTEREIIGKENAKNQTQIRYTVAQIMEKTKGDARYSILTRLADKLETQKDITIEIQKQLKEESLEKLVKSKMTAALGETFLEECSKDPKMRLATLEFFTNARTSQSVHKFQKSLVEFSRKNELGEDKKDKIAYHMHNVASTEEMNLLHQNFWSLPFEGRQLALDKILFPVHEKTEADFNRNMKYALDKVFTSSLNSNDRIGRDIVQSFLSVCDEDERRLLLSAMLVANEPGTEKGKTRNVGKTLNQLKALGPAGDKLLQAIHSHPSTPENIREEIGESKSNSQWVPRWKIFEWLESFGPDREVGASPTVHVGKLLGVGAYGATVALEKADGQHTACTLLKPSAEALASGMFEKFGAASEVLIEKRKNMKPVREMIGQAGRMSKIETDMSIAKSQAEVAAKNYNGMRVTVDGQEFTFETAKWVGNGQRYKETAIVDGLHFNELPTGTEAERSFKHRAAMAQLGAEVYLRLTGKAVDHDRHGAQQRILGTRIGVFDHGGQAVVAPTIAEKRLLAQVLTNTIKSNYGFFGHFGTPLSTALMNEIQRAGKTSEDREYLSAMQRDILALGDFVKGAVETAGPKQNVMKDIIGAVIRSGDMDPVITDEIKKNLGRHYDRAMAEMAASGTQLTIAPAPIVKAAAAESTGTSPEQTQTKWAEQVRKPATPVELKPKTDTNPGSSAQFAGTRKRSDRWSDDMRAKLERRSLTGSFKE